ncbi:MAG: hypothetical protein NVSMB20_00110 [Bradyrhizobium sp.]
MLRRDRVPPAIVPRVLAAASIDLNSEIAVIPEQAVLDQLLLGTIVLTVAVFLLPLLLMIAGVGAVTLRWFAAAAAVLGALVFWLVFPGTYGLVVLLFALVVGLLVVGRGSRRGSIRINTELPARRSREHGKRRYPRDLRSS